MGVKCFKVSWSGVSWILLICFLACEGKLTNHNVNALKWPGNKSCFSVTTYSRLSSNIGLMN